MPNTLALLLAPALVAYAAPNPKPFTQNSKGLTQNNISGLTQNLDRGSTSTATETDSSLSNGIQRPKKPLPLSPSSKITLPTQALKRGDAQASLRAAEPEKANPQEAPVEGNE